MQMFLKNTYHVNSQEKFMTKRINDTKQGEEQIVTNAFFRNPNHSIITCGECDTTTSRHKVKFELSYKKVM